MGGKSLAGVGFGPKPTPDPNFTKIGLGHRTGPYIRSLHFLTSGLLNCMKRQSQYLFDVVADKSNLHLAYSALPVRDESLGCAESGEQSPLTALKPP